MSMSGGESYIHLLIPRCKTCRPDGRAVAKFMERVVQFDFIGQDCELRASQVIRVEPKVQERRNPFTGQSLKVQSKSRKSQPPTLLKETFEIGLIAQGEYNVSLASSSRPLAAPFALGNRGMDGVWQTFNDDYDLEIGCHVRNAIVRVCRFDNEQGHSSPPSPIQIPLYDEDCTENESDGFFEHPDTPHIVRIPSAGCARFWITFEPGKWIWPAPVNDGIGRLNPSLVELAATSFGTEFVEAYDWL